MGILIPLDPGATATKEVSATKRTKRRNGRRGGVGKCGRDGGAVHQRRLHQPTRLLLSIANAERRRTDDDILPVHRVRSPMEGVVTPTPTHHKRKKETDKERTNERKHTEKENIELLLIETLPGVDYLLECKNI